MIGPDRADKDLGDGIRISCSQLPPLTIIQTFPQVVRLFLPILSSLDSVRDVLPAEQLDAKQLDTTARNALDKLLDQDIGEFAPVVEKLLGLVNDSTMELMRLIFSMSSLERDGKSTPLDNEQRINSAFRNCAGKMIPAFVFGLGVNYRDFFSGVSTETSDQS